MNELQDATSLLGLELPQSYSVVLEKTLESPLDSKVRSHMPWGEIRAGFRMD